MIKDPELRKLYAEMNSGETPAERARACGRFFDRVMVLEGMSRSERRKFKASLVAEERVNREKVDASVQSLIELLRS